MSIVRILQIALIGLMASALDAYASGPIQRTVNFSILLEGQNIGRHTLAFERQGDDQIVTISVDISVQKMGVVAYRFKHRAREVWKGGQLESLKANTEDNGQLYAVEGHHTGRGFEVERAVFPEVSAAEIANGGMAVPVITRETFSADTLPTSLWNVETLKRSALLNSEFGTLSKIQAQTLGREIVSLRSGNLEATRHHFNGDLHMDLWFDDSGRWVKAVFVAPDGSTVDYILDE